METTTNAMRLLRQAGIEFGESSYEVDENDLSGVHAAEMLGVNENRVRRAARDGRIPSMQLGNRTLVDVDAARGVLSPEPEGVKIDVVSEETGLTVTAIRRAVRDGWLPYIKPGKAYLFRMEDVRAAIEKRMEEQAKKDS